MIKRESLQKKLAMAAIAGMLMLLLAASCVAQTPLEVGGPENCTDCSGNASADQTEGGSIAEAEASSSPGFENAVQETNSSNASISQALGVADLVSPSGILNTGRPEYVWEGVSGSQYYCLEVMDDRNDVVLKQWYNATDYPDTISVTPLQSLDPGDYTWRILCWNCQNQNEQPSPEMEFTVCTSTSFPGRATLISPRDTIGSRNPAFVWSPVTGCTRYCLKVANANYQNVPILEECYDAEEVISGQSCSVTPGLDLDPGSYRWWIQTINCKGEGPWSNYKSFRYQNRSPGRSTPISPRGGISTDTPTFTWAAASAAATYHLELINYQDGIDVPVMEDPSIDANEVTIGSRCSFILGTLPDDDSVYYWRIHASNDAGDGAWSGWRYFETHCALEPGTDKKKARTG